MSKFLSTHSIFLAQPKTPEEVDALLPDLEKLVRLIPEAADWGDEYLKNIREYPHYLTLVYHEDQPVGYIQIEDNEGYDHLGKDSLEFSGSVIPDYRAKGLTQLVSPAVIRRSFENNPTKKKMLAATPEENKEAQAALSALGFRRIGKNAQKHLLYRLDRKDALA